MLTNCQKNLNIGIGVVFTFIFSRLIFAVYLRGTREKNNKFTSYYSFITCYVYL